MSKTSKQNAETKPTETTELAVAENNTAISTDVMDLDFAADGAQFDSGFTREDFQMPFLQLIQSNSPQVKEGEAKFIEAAKAGMLIETATNELFDIKKRPLKIIFVSYRKTFIEWVTRKAGSGFVKDHGLEAGAALYAKCVKNEDRKMIVPGTDGKHELVETMQYVVLFESNDGEWKGAVLPLVSTQLKRGRVVNKTLDDVRIDVKGSKVRPPMFYSVFTDGPAVLEKKDQNSWYSHNFSRMGAVVDLPGGVDIYKMARELRTSVDIGAVDLSKAAEADGNAGGEDAEPGNAAYADGSDNAF